MYRIPRMGPRGAMLSFASLAVAATIAIASVQMERDTHGVVDDRSFRSVMLHSSGIFTFGEVSEALDHWTELWEASAHLDCRTMDARRRLLVSSAGFIVTRARDTQEIDSLRDLRDHIESRLVAGRRGEAVDSADLQDWIALNRILDENKRTIAWMADRRQISTASPLPGRACEDAIAVMMDAGDWAEAGSLLSGSCPSVYQLMDQLELEDDLLEGMSDPNDVRCERDDACATLATRYGCLLAAGRDAEAERLSHLVRSRHAVEEIPPALVEGALRCGAPRQRHRTLLAESTHGELRERLEAALESAGAPRGDQSVSTYKPLSTM